MAADLHIHVLEGATEADIAVFNAHSLGSKHFTWAPVNEQDEDRASKSVTSTPSVWIGEVSWLKAALFDDAETFIPGPVQAIQELIGEDLPVLDAALEAKIIAALEGANSTSYSLAKPDEVRAFLKDHHGKRLFTISW